jgi:hypothetical protein
MSQEEPRYRVTGGNPVAASPRPSLDADVHAASSAPRPPFDPEGGKDIVITVSPSEVDNMLFDTTTRDRVDGSLHRTLRAPNLMRRSVRFRTGVGPPQG